jgi:hypothetical protein
VALIGMGGNAKNGLASDNDSIAAFEARSRKEGHCALDGALPQLHNTRQP